MDRKRGSDGLSLQTTKTEYQLSARRKRWGRKWDEPMSQDVNTGRGILRSRCVKACVDVHICVRLSTVNGQGVRRNRAKGNETENKKSFHAQGMN